jgi:hypothetical protein
MTGLDEEVQWAEYLFHSFILELPLGYNDELVRSFGTCLRWAAEPVGQVMSPAATLILNNDNMGPHGADAASGSGDVVEEVEASETEVPELVEDGPMDVDEDLEGGEVEVDEDEDEEQEEEEEEDDDRLWPVSSHPLVSSFVQVAPERRLTG